MTSLPPTLPAEISRLLRQQDLIAAFGQFALQEVFLPAVLDKACQIAVEGLQSQLSKVLRHQPAAGELLMVAGVGWRPGLVGTSRLGADRTNPAGYALLDGKPVISNDIVQDPRFSVPAVMLEHGIKRAINVLIGGTGTPVYGVLEVDANDGDQFETYDIAFLQALANTIAAVVAREDRQLALQHSQALSSHLFESSPDCIKILEVSGRIQTMNGNGLALMEIDNLANVVGRAWEDLWPESEHYKVRTAIETAKAGGVGRFEAFRGTPKGTPKWWDVTVGPVGNRTGLIESLVTVSRDVTQRHLDLEARDALLRQKDLLMQEVHHRVRNSLQLVHTLLQLQGGTITDRSARQALAEAGQRVMTIAAVHRQLYMGKSVHEAELQPYLAGLLDDLGVSLIDQSKGRSIVSSADSTTLSSECLTWIGLVVAELVTNAVKYGEGEVKVGVSVQEATVQISVQDEGAGFPQDFNPSRSNGLGMRLVMSMAENDGVKIDRTGHSSRIIVLLPRR
jgi:PAS domain S-box-containing protein